MATQYAFGKIVTNGLVLALDAADKNSYPGSGTTWSNLAGSNNGTLTNGPTFNSANGGSIVFDGTNDILYVPISLNTSGNHTIEVIAKCNTMTSDNGNRQTIWSLNNGTEGYQLLDLEVWGDNAYSFNGNGTSFTGGPATVANFIQANNIHFYTLSISGGVFNWYIDSILINSFTPTYTGTSTYFKLATRGADALGTGQQWNGLVFNCKIFNRALSTQEILQNYNAQKSRFNL